MNGTHMLGVTVDYLLPPGCAYFIAPGLEGEPAGSCTALCM